MGVELQHAVVYGYIVDVEERHTDGDDPRLDPYLDAPDSDAVAGQFVTLTPEYGQTEPLVAGVLRFLTDSARWKGAQTLPFMRLEEPDYAERAAMEELIDELPVERRHEEAAHITLTYKW